MSKAGVYCKVCSDIVTDPRYMYWRDTLCLSCYIWAYWEFKALERGSPCTVCGSPRASRWCLNYGSWFDNLCVGCVRLEMGGPRARP